MAGRPALPLSADQVNACRRGLTACNEADQIIQAAQECGYDCREWAAVSQYYRQALNMILEKAGDKRVKE